MIKTCDLVNSENVNDSRNNLLALQNYWKKKNEIYNKIKNLITTCTTQEDINRIDNVYTNEYLSIPQPQRNELYNISCCKESTTKLYNKTAKSCVELPTGVDKDFTFISGISSGAYSSEILAHFPNLESAERDCSRICSSNSKCLSFQTLPDETGSTNNFSCKFYTRKPNEFTLSNSSNMYFKINQTNESVKEDNKTAIYASVGVLLFLFVIILFVLVRKRESIKKYIKSFQKIPIT